MYQNLLKALQHFSLNVVMRVISHVVSLEKMFEVFFHVPLDHAAPTMCKVKNCILMFIARYGAINDKDLPLAILLEILPDILTSLLSSLINFLTTFGYCYC